ncbi:hypothetical protein EI200_01340 [Peribacillus simplex]|uniref:hypothetical protein n=1 Tax=Peribacillus simplex TaxID=1478 RepID=UPI000F637AFA|nr:hypothetical protein [Peribacillus simplex]RRN75040.1 hypothetical protein EI200_01340 [Peribacillus simplex]
MVQFQDFPNHYRAKAKYRQWLLLASVILRNVAGMDVPDVADAVQTGAVILPAFGITLITC